MPTILSVKRIKTKKKKKNNHTEPPSQIDKEQE